jgi:glucose-6-phosphate 1-dehydrogenase
MSKTATYAAVVVHILSERWKDVPILMQCGKALNTTKSEIIVNFRSMASKKNHTPHADEDVTQHCTRIHHCCLTLTPCMCHCVTAVL